VTEIKQGQFFRILTTEAAHSSKDGSTEGESMYTKLMKCLEVLDETK
jgi:hypothetical protein